MKYKRLSEYKVEKIMKCFCEDLTASTTARILSVNRNTINRYFNEFCQRIFEYSIKNNKKDCGEFEVDESYFRARRVREEKGMKKRL